MKEILKEFAAYNLWANQLITDAIIKLTPEQQEQTIVSSYSSIQLTLQHLALVEWIWYQRMKLIETPLPPAGEPTPVKESIDKLLQHSKLWKEWVENSSLQAIEHEFSYRNSKREQFKQPMYQMLLHLFNHQTYHRGQLVTMFRQLNVGNIPATDFIVWSRTKK